MARIKVRFAPSPTGILHVGGIRTALFNYFFAKSEDGVFILRNEDTDQARKVEGSLDATLESLKWLGVEWDELVTQSERLSIYKKYADELVVKGMAKGEEGAIRFITPKEGLTIWSDAIGKKEISFENQNIEDFIILKKDGFPTYHLANVVDDHLMEITHIIRGEDWIPSTPKHIMLYKALGWEMPIFAHVPNVLGTDGKKLSKRRGAKSVLDFKSEGYLPEALLNYLMLIGWSPKDDREILSKDEISIEFSLDKINVAPAIFDERKLLWMNGEYIRKTQIPNLKNQILEFDKDLKQYDQELIEKLIEPAKTRMKTLADFKVMVQPFLSGIASSEIKTKLAQRFANIDVWNKDSIVETIKKFLQDEGLNFPNLYEALIGVRQGLPLGDVFEIMGKDKTLDFLK